jgi:hypothetical protein
VWQGCTVTIYRIRPTDLEWRLIDGEVVALDFVRSEYIGVNASGALLWESLVAGATRAALLEGLLDRFEVSAVQAEADLTAFLATLDSAGVLETSPGGSVVP